MLSGYFKLAPALHKQDCRSSNTLLLEQLVRPEETKLVSSHLHQLVEENLLPQPLQYSFHLYLCCC